MNLFGPPPPPPPRPASWGELPEVLTDKTRKATSKRMKQARIMFLEKFHGRPMTQDDIDYYEENESWVSALGIQVSLLKTEFEAEGLIERANPIDHLEILLNSLLSLKDIKEGLASIGEKKTGKKGELIIRMINANRKAAIELLPNITGWLTTKKGGDLVDAYLTDKETKKTRVEDDLLGMVSNKMYKEASKARSNYNATLVFPPGLNCSWDNWNTDRDCNILDAICSQVPQVLADRSIASLEASRIIACLSYLLGISKPSRRLLNQIPHDKSNLEDARLLQNYAIGRVNIEEWKALSKYVRILDAGDSSCEICKKFSREVYRIGSEPELPHKSCTHPFGCRCCYVTATTY